MVMSRRTALGASFVAGAGALLAGSATALAAPLPEGAAVDATSALDLLKKGNLRWQRGEQRHPHEGAARRSELVAGQQPFAIILGCADSRVPPELVFDRGLGDLFTVRSAGQVLDESVLGSIVYGVEHLHVPLIVVLGHASCGAVAAAVDAHETGQVPGGHVGYLVEQILPVIEATPGGDDPVDAGVSANARHIAGLLRADPELAGHVADGSLRVVAARYDLDDSRVSFLD
ncbi:carbonic anhydrase [Marinactinospora thermotolerans]|uniref:carbonic anhydrase n=1 Tax=Marinactinospora thermotolerans DSM 45154 TaxID=1122192 RepID=A0A1T4MX46_9ACTN|nr:carbonic anhydrase [Marinactinospora thermotolerans]SJZ71629.1 carbonic anhydrase [Marinactinospora thermotolerans DSM 45154]